jgi:hypothetical protein
MIEVAFKDRFTGALVGTGVGDSLPVLYESTSSSMSLTYMSSSADCRTDRSIKAQFFSEIFCSNEAI